MKKDEKPLNLEEVRKLLVGCAKGLQHLHKHRNNHVNVYSNLEFVHRDIAARNVLLSENLNPKISDFGMTRKLHLSQGYDFTKSTLGPIRWMSPESLKEQKYSMNLLTFMITLVGYKSDAWSYGNCEFRLKK